MHFIQEFSISYPSIIQTLQPSQTQTINYQKPQAATSNATITPVSQNSQELLAVIAGSGIEIPAWISTSTISVLLGFFLRRLLFQFL